MRRDPRAPGIVIARLGVQLAAAQEPWGLAARLGLASPRPPARAAPADASETGQALSAVAAALGNDELPGEGRTGVVWSTATAGLEEYRQTLAEITVEGPGRVSPRRAARSAFTGPATAVSVEFGADGPCVTLTGTREAAGHSVVEAARMLERDECARVVVGGSARPAEPGSAAEALCAVLHRATGAEPPGAGVRPLGRARVGDDAAGFVADCLRRVRGAPGRVLVSADLRQGRPADVIRHLCPAPCTWIEEHLGDLGVLGTLAAVVSAAALHGAGPDQADAPTFIVALGGHNAIAIEVTSGRRRPQCN